MNCTYVVALSAIYNAVFCVTDPRDADPAELRLLPAGAGDRSRGHRSSTSGIRGRGRRQHRPAAEARRPAARGARRRPCPIGWPLRAAARARTCSSAASHPETGQYYSNYHFDGMGAGGSARADGNDGEVTRHSNCRNTPIEVFEHRYPLRTLDYALVPDSGGAGEHRGGPVDDADAAGDGAARSRSARSSIAAASRRAGCSAACPRLGSELLVRRAGERRVRRLRRGVRRRLARPSSRTSSCAAGDELRYRTPGGGGFGDPAKRDPALIERDIREAACQPAAAAARLRRARRRGRVRHERRVGRAHARVERHERRATARSAAA